MRDATQHAAQGYITHRIAASRSPVCSTMIRVLAAPFVQGKRIRKTFARSRVAAARCRRAEGTNDAGIRWPHHAS